MTLYHGAKKRPIGYFESFKDIRSDSKVRKCSPGGRSEPTGGEEGGVGFVKQVSFKQGVKEREFNLNHVIL